MLVLFICCVCFVLCFDVFFVLCLVVFVLFLVVLSVGQPVLVMGGLTDVIIGVWVFHGGSSRKFSFSFVCDIF